MPSGYRTIPYFPNFAHTYVEEYSANSTWNKRSCDPRTKSVQWG